MTNIATCSNIKSKKRQDNIASCASMDIHHRPTQFKHSVEIDMLEVTSNRKPIAQLMPPIWAAEELQLNLPKKNWSTYPS